MSEKQTKTESKNQESTEVLSAANDVRFADAKRSKTGLLPCPFCGSIDLSLVSAKHPDKSEPQKPFMILCNDCGASGPGKKTDEKELRARWNIRANQI